MAAAAAAALATWCSSRPCFYLIIFPQAAGQDVSMEVHDDRALLALQGPSAMKVLQGMTKHDLSKFYFGNFARFDVAGIPCWVTRTG